MFKIFLRLTLFFTITITCYSQKTTMLVNFSKSPDSIDVWTGNPSFDVDENLAYILYTDSNSLKGKICRYNLKTNQAEWSDDLFDTVALDDVSHNDAAIVIDGDGYLHVWIGMHNHSMKYYRSTSPGSFNSFKNRSTEMPFYEFGKTYPWVTSASNGDVFMMCRRTAGVHDEKQDLYHWNHKNKRWTMQTVAAKPADCAYMGSIFGDDSGNVHIAIAWADFHKGGNRFQKGMYMKYNISQNKFYKADGTEISKIPVSYDTKDADLFYNNKFAWGDGPEIQTPRIITDGNHVPMISFPHSKDLGENWTYKVAKWNGNQWEETLIYKDANMYARPPITNNGSTINVFMTNAEKNKISVARINSKSKFKKYLLIKKGHYYSKMALKFKENTDLMITKTKLFKIEY